MSDLVDIVEGMIEIQVAYRANAATPPSLATIRARPEAIFVQEFCLLTQRPWEKKNTYVFLAVKGDQGGSGSWRIDTDLTVSQLHAFAAGERLLIDTGGRGGGPIPLVSELLEASLQVAGVSTLVGLGAKAMSGVVNAPKRQAVRDWMADEGGTDNPPGLTLQRQLRRQRSHFLGDIERQYGVDAEVAAKLLRGTGFRKLPDDPYGYPESWRRIETWPRTHFRALRSADVELLELATLGNMNWCGDRLTIEAIRSRPEYSHYTYIVPERGDFGVVAEIGGEAVGVAWAVFLPTSDAGYGFVDETTPELSLWVAAEQRGIGLGRDLLRALIDEAKERGLKQISLSVEADNYAKVLYRCEGFRDVPGGEADGVMIRTLLTD
ncbi:N-acetyltransferase family protein [Microbacterium sp. YY-03]|uniref:GNAT family N-acetyltransferase n=1 Tax=Microbacterium sp. YY-03 TaxID=3421636 RepID=UPI003D16C571